MQIKHRSWFAVGPEVQEALSLLSDGSFRLYFHLCLSANRSTGRVLAKYPELASRLGKSGRSIASYFEELKLRGVCRVHPAVNQHSSTEIEICDAFWPYIKTDTAASPDSDEYLARIQSFLTERACVRSAFTPAERRLASQLEGRDVPLEQIRRGIALGCSRKYVSLLNGAESGPIQSFFYFKDLIEEAGDVNTPTGYWDYLAHELKHLESRWLAKSR